MGLLGSIKDGIGNVIKNPKDALLGSGIGGVVAGPVGGVVGGLLGKDKIVAGAKDLASDVADGVGLGDTSTAGIDAAQQNQRAFANSLQAQYGNSNLSAPRVNAPTDLRAQTIGAIDVGNAPTIRNPGIVNPGQVRAAQVGAPDSVQATHVSHRNLGDASLAAAVQGQASQARAASSQFQGINRAAVSGYDGQLRDAYGHLAGAAAGTAPSQAQGVLRQGLDEAIAAQMGAAAAARGRNIGLAQRGAQVQGARMQQVAANNAAMLRAQEMATARAQYANTMQAARGQDIGMASQDSQLANQVGMANAGLANSVNLANADALTRTSLANASNSTNVNLANASSQNQNRLAQGQMDFDTDKLNSAQDFAGQLANQSARKDVALANAGFEQDAGKFNINTALDLNKARAALSLDTQKASADLLQKGQFKQADVDMAIAGKNAEFVNSLALEMKKMGVEVSLANAKNLLEARGMDDARSANLAQAIMAAQAADMAAEVNKINVSNADNNRRLGFASGIIGGAGDLAAAYMTSGASTAVK